MKKPKASEEATAAQLITGLNSVPAKELKTVKRDIEKIKRARANKGQPCDDRMKKLLNRKLLASDSEASEDDEVEDNLVHADEEEYAALVGGGSYSTAPTAKERRPHHKNKPNVFVSNELYEFEDIFIFACMNVLKEDYLSDLKCSAETGIDWRRNKEELDSITKWLTDNTRTPLIKLNQVISGNEDLVALFTQLTHSVSLKFEQPDDGNYSCIISGKDIDADECTRIEVIEDPRLYKPMCKTAEREFNPEPRVFYISNRFRNVVYSVFHLRTLVDDIGIRCLRWAKQQGILYTAGAKNIVSMFQESEKGLLESILENFKVSKATVEAFCRNKK